MKKFLPALSAIALALPLFAQAATTTVMFDPDGAGAKSAVAIDLLDFAVGNALSVGGGANLAVGKELQLLYQANLGVASLGGTTQAVSCFDGANCFTAVAGFRETVATLTGMPGGTSSATFSLLPNPGQTAPDATNFFYVYAKPATQGINLTGQDFATGTLVLSGYVTGLNSSNFSSNGAFDQFDKVGANNYPGVTSLVGSGATDITVKLTSANASYFPGFMSSGLAFSFFNTSAVTPFNQVDPSMRFSSNGIANGDFVPVIGTVNGVNGRDFQLQADANQSFLAPQVVPEPGSLALVGLALAGVGLARRRRG